MSLFSEGVSRGRNGCAECRGTGKCADCGGTGVNLRLNESDPKCRPCSGTGTCSDCQGTGRAYPVPQEIQDLGLDKL